MVPKHGRRKQIFVNDIHLVSMPRTLRGASPHAFLSYSLTPWLGHKQPGRQEHTLVIQYSPVYAGMAPLGVLEVDDDIALAAMEAAHHGGSAVQNAINCVQVGERDTPDQLLFVGHQSQCGCTQVAALMPSLNL
jgi:hypothetical protein